MLELVLYRSAQGIPTPKSKLSDLEEAIMSARQLIDEDELVDIVEIREANKTVCTVGRGWMSRKQAN